MRDWAKRIQREWGHQGVWVPKYSKAQPCTWKAGGRKHARVWLNFDVLLEIMEFSLDNAYVKMQDGRILKQLLGIPMGDPISPGMTESEAVCVDGERVDAIADEREQTDVQSKEVHGRYSVVVCGLTAVGLASFPARL